MTYVSTSPTTRSGGRFGGGAVQGAKDVGEGMSEGPVGAVKGVAKGTGTVGKGVVTGTVETGKGVAKGAGAVGKGVVKGTGTAVKGVGKGVGYVVRGETACAEQGILIRLIRQDRAFPIDQRDAGRVFGQFPFGGHGHIIMDR